MHKLTFYQHKRVDGSLRTGIEIDDETVWHRLQKGKGEPDPVLRWFVDVRCRGAKLPLEAEKARAWLLDHAAPIHDGLRDLADRLQGGMEPDVWPLVWDLSNPPAGTKVAIACSVMRRLDALDVSRIVRNLDKNWERLLRKLKRPEAVSP